MLRRAFGGDQARGPAELDPTRPGPADASADQPRAGEGDDMDRQREGAPSVSGELNALLGRGSEFDGKLAFEGTVRIDGTFTGEITTSDTLIIGESARVNAEISCGTIVVNGEVNGNIRATQSVELHKPARVRGDVTTPSLVVERGVVFDGRSKMEDADSGKIVPISAAEAD